LELKKNRGRIYCGKQPVERSKESIRPNQRDQRSERHLFGICRKQRKYFRNCQASDQEHDPNHMLTLGVVFRAGACRVEPRCFKAAKEHVDILSINWYGNDFPMPEQMGKTGNNVRASHLSLRSFIKKAWTRALGNTSERLEWEDSNADRGTFIKISLLGLTETSELCRLALASIQRQCIQKPNRIRPNRRFPNKGIVTSVMQPHEDLISQMAIIK